MKRLLYWLLLLATACPLAAQIRVLGFPPPGITTASLQYDYRRIWAILAPQQPIDLSPLTAEFFFRREMPQEAEGLPEWGGGGAVGRNKIVILLDVQPFLNQNFPQITLHELTHIVLNRVCPQVELPRWFQEGMAMTLSGESNFQEQFILSQAVLIHNFIPLAAIDSVNTFGKFKAEVAYCQSRQAALYMVDTWGMESLRDILQKTNQLGDFWQAVDQVLAISAPEFERLYFDHLNKRFEALVWLSDTYLLWLAIALLFVVAYIVTKIRNARKSRQLEAEDEQSDDSDEQPPPPQDPAS